MAAAVYTLDLSRISEGSKLCLENTYVNLKYFSYRFYIIFFSKSLSIFRIPLVKNEVLG
jgi:hypothetical protein